MFRIAVIQNEVEMQHSGYVDSVPKYVRQNFKLQEHVFNRFSSVNIRNLFVEEENYLLDYDCLIIGTNATSDGDVYSILCEENNKTLLGKFISLGKGLLICSQKKFKESQNNNLGLYKARETFFLPDEYEYKVVSRPKDESSADGSILIYEQNINSIQKFLISYPEKITNEIIDEHCNKNDFQKHYYRDFIIPVNDSSYFPVLIDPRSPNRNTLMVACPQKSEKIVISTIALDWAGHYELIENILYYLIIGIPSVAFISKSSPSKEFEFIISEAELSKISYISYNSLDEVLSKKNSLKNYHSLYVFSPEFLEEEVADFWKEQLQVHDGYIKLFYYKYIKGELVLVNFSYYSYIDTQKKEVETWLKCKNQDGFWDNSFWKTYDALFALQNMGVSIAGFLKGVFAKIERHYQNGSYDGVLAPTCGLLELEALVLSTDGYKDEVSNIQQFYLETKEWLIQKYKETSGYNKKFIVRSFYNCKKFSDLSNAISNFKEDLQIIALDGAFQDKLEIDLCLDIEVCLIYLDTFDDRKKDIRNRINDCVENILKTQMQNGRWDNNFGKTARLLVFLLKYQNRSEFEYDKDSVQKAINSGITALRNAYHGNNWEDNIVTTANAITAIIAADAASAYESKDFLNQVNKEAKIANSYDSLLLALRTIDRLIKLNSESNIKLKELEKIKTDFEKSQSQLKVAISVASVSFLLVLSYYIFLCLKDLELFKSMIMESFMWIPIVVGVLITGFVGFLPKCITRKRKKEK